MRTTRCWCSLMPSLPHSTTPKPRASNHTPYTLRLTPSSVNPKPLNLSLFLHLSPSHKHTLFRCLSLTQTLPHTLSLSNLQSVDDKVLVLRDALITAHLNPKPRPLTHQLHTSSLRPSRVNPNPLFPAAAHTLCLSNLQSADDEVLALLDTLRVYAMSSECGIPKTVTTRFWPLRVYLNIYI